MSKINGEGSFFFGGKEKKEFGEDLVEKKKKEENIWKGKYFLWISKKGVFVTSDHQPKQPSVVLTPSYDLGKHKPEVEEWKRLPSNTNIFDYSAIVRGVREMVALRDMITGKPELSRPAAGNRSNPWPKHLSAEPPTLTDGCVCVTIHIFFHFFLAQRIWFSFETGKVLSLMCFSIAIFEFSSISGVTLPISDIGVPLLCLEFWGLPHPKAAPWSLLAAQTWGQEGPHLETQLNCTMLLSQCKSGS